MVQVYGALAEVLRVQPGRRRQDPDRLVWRDRSGDYGEINADLLLKRLWVDGSDTATVDHLTKVAEACGQLPNGLVEELGRRRASAARQLAARTNAIARSVLLTPCWRLVVGHGEDTVHETGLTMSPTYGIPILPGSALKGVAAAHARALHGTPLPGAVARLFGTPRPDSDTDAARGTVTLLDALPERAPNVVVDVLTPHVKPYYDQENGRPKEPPAEYHNPVPVRFLAVDRTPFRSWLIGPPADVEQLGRLLCDGVDDLGVGGKTAAGYGYCKAVLEP